jgi:uncharacterized protein (DUF58 family)
MTNWPSVNQGGIPRPIIVPKSAVILEFIGLALFVVARTTGAGWDIVVLCAIIAVVLTGSLLPAFVLGRATVAATAPADATVGRPFPIELRVNARHVKLQVLTFDSDWIRIDRPGAGPVLVTPTRRGVLTRVRIELVTAAPLGLARWRRRIRVTLPNPVEIAPRREPTRCPIHAGIAATTAAHEASSTSGRDLTRGVREYVDGDPIRSVHWPATARTGAVMIREFEGPRRPHVIIVADLRGPDREGVASRAAGMADDALRHGARVQLATAELDGPRFGDVPSPLHVGRRLARAVVGAPASPSSTEGVTVHHLGGGGHR